jgi:hypothetical protein
VTPQMTLAQILSRGPAQSIADAVAIMTAVAAA